MLELTKDMLKKQFNIDERSFEIYNQAMSDVKNQFEQLEAIREYNQLKVLNAFQKEKISDTHFTNSTGYGYDDIGRDAFDRVYARIFNTESAIVRPHFVNGTHAIGAALYGVLAPGDTMMTITGTPYDTLHNVIGLNRDHNGTLKYYGINYKQVDLNNDNKIDIEKVLEELKNDTSIKLIHIQRSPGYSWRSAFSVKEIGKAIEKIKSLREDVIIFIDNCYGEFVDVIEPTDVGADLMAGSLIKNIGGGLSPAGGYVVGKKEYVEGASFRLTIPGIGGECGATFGLMRQFYQGLFMAPHVTIEALKTSILCARMMELIGAEVLPSSTDARNDIIQAIKFNDKDKVIAFCKGIQKGSPIDSFVECEPWPMPGYDDDVIMAAGAFIQGASVELSADAPIREPYIAYMQGGLTFNSAKIGLVIALSNVLNVDKTK
ncbi:methionine gamma-lyase family protein [Oceanirhabdus sp. W0125-5]|uniref:methionine gamma-lyase family protein n=1 Tax=Oceanirhabdus sp. W0125-5 TaxID=2999116 RepID=UPI0022F2E533|nr:methionine gamma-lyase family protein [Oceanirhabdus sp. W0125-5]WBW95113.1 methionine gamma-lyase family protein [Oceanirhabdus sp. W0125-5]